MIPSKTLISLSAAAMVFAGGVPATAAADTFQAANFFNLAGDTVQPSAGTLTRSKQSIEANLALSGLDPGAAYTLWWVIWNDPNACATTPCGEDDLGLSGNAVINATGFVTGEDGTASVRARLNSGNLPTGVNAIIPGQLMRGRGFRAEVHMVVQSHGPIMPGEVDTQISEFMGACNPACEDQQAIVFLP